MSERCPTCEHELLFYTDYPTITVQALEIVPIKEKQVKVFPDSLNKDLYDASNSAAVREYLQSIQDRIGSDIKPSDLNPPLEEETEHPSFFRIDLGVRRHVWIKPNASTTPGEVMIRLGYIYTPFQGEHATIEGTTIARIRFEGKLNLPQ